MTTFLIQDTRNDHTVELDVRACEELHIPYMTFGVIPTTNTITGLNDKLDPYEEYIIRCGTSIVEILAKDLSLSEMNIINSINDEDFEMRIRLGGGLWHNDTGFDQQHYSSNISLPLLNADAKFYSYEDAKHLVFDEPMFIKPSDDLKAFSASLLTPGFTLEQYINETMHQKTYLKSTVLIAPESPPIIAEARFICLNGKVLDGSFYRYRDKTKHVRIGRDYTELFTVAREYASLYKPDDVYSMDIAVLRKPNGEHDYKIVEYNCFNASGLYAMNIPLVFSHLFNMKEDY